MKTLTKILTVTIVALSTLIVTFCTAFAGTVGTNTSSYYTPTYNLRSFTFAPSNTSSHVALNDVSIYARGDSVRAYTEYTLTNSGGLLASFLTATTFSDSRLFSRFTIDGGFNVDISLTFGDMVLNPSLASGAVNFLDARILPSPYDDCYTTVRYYGTCYFPTVTGGFSKVPFDISSTILEDANLATQNVRVSLAPSELVSGNSFDKLSTIEFYQSVYDYQIDKTNLVNPYISSFFRANDVIVLSTYYVDIYSSYTMYDDTTLYPENSSEFILELPASLDGASRPNEEFISSWLNYVERPVDFEDFSFVAWIENIVLGFGTIEILPNFYLLYPIVGSVALALIIWALKIFLGG